MEPETRSEAVTHGVRVVVQSQYLDSHSSPMLGRYVFAYRVRIENVAGAGPLRLRSRHWLITDQTGKVQEVRGPGVVGEQPLLQVGEGFEYTSGAILETPRGQMRGSYQMEGADGSSLEVEIAPFALAMPFSLN